MSLRSKERKGKIYTRKEILIKERMETTTFYTVYYMGVLIPRTTYTSYYTAQYTHKITEMQMHTLFNTNERQRGP